MNRPPAVSPGALASGNTSSSAGGPSLEVGRILEQALAGGEVSIDQGTRLLDAAGADLPALFAAADTLRRQAVGDVVTYVVNRNINFTNVCVKRCGFCAFSRGHKAAEGYFLPMEEVVRRAKEAAELGATEVCVQAGLAPGIDGWQYVNTCKAITDAVPGLHVHGFSPEEVLYGSELTGVSIEHYLRALQDVGLGSLPGTSAEILIDRVRDVIAPGRITTAQWKDVIGTAHRLGIRTTSTIMYGHVETSHDKAVHLDLLRGMQKDNFAAGHAGFTEFVPLGFIFDEAPMFQRRRPPGLRMGPTGIETLKLYAVSRIMLHGYIPNIQVSWVKEGAKLSQVGLMAGANDLGGTLINESISTAAGSKHGQLLTPARFRELAREMGRIPAERTTTYGLRLVFADPAQDPHDALDKVENAEKLFGSYHQLIADQNYRFKAVYQKDGLEHLDAPV